MMKRGAVFYKEWIKLRWIIISLIIISIIILFAQHFVIRKLNLSKSETYFTYWLILFDRDYFGVFKIFLPLTGIVIALFQFLPERFSFRFRIALMLPQSQRKTTLQMLFFGTLILTTLFVIIFILANMILTRFSLFEFALFSNNVFLSWFLAGYACYFLISAVIMEPDIKLKFTFGVLLSGVIMVFLNGTLSRSFASINPYAAFLTAFLFFIPMYAINRFVKGVS